MLEISEKDKEEESEKEHQIASTTTIKKMR